MNIIENAKIVILNRNDLKFDRKFEKVTFKDFNRNIILKNDMVVFIDEDHKTKIIKCRWFNGGTVCKNPSRTLLSRLFS
jgi:hypothetical protein